MAALVRAETRDRGIPPRRVLLGGFSQGGALALGGGDGETAAETDDGWRAAQVACGVYHTLVLLRALSATPSLASSHMHLLPLASPSHEKV